MQEQNTNLTNQTSLCGQIIVSRANVHEYCTQNDGVVDNKISNCVPILEKEEFFKKYFNGI